MHRVPILLCALLLPFAGCLGGETDTDRDTEGPTNGPPSTEIPEGFTESGFVPISMDQFNFAGMGPCSTPTHDCRIYEFTVNASAAMTAILTWTVPANDFDLYLYKGGQQLDVSGDFPPETEERIDHKLQPGTYELWVVPWAVVGDQFELAVTFS